LDELLRILLNDLDSGAVRLALLALFLYVIWLDHKKVETLYEWYLSRKYKEYPCERETLDESESRTP
jgi:hypothetical protein